MAEAREAISTVLLQLYAQESGDAARWYYRDQNGEVQGPFDSKQMDKWYDGFPDDLWIRGGMKGEWVPLCDVSPKIFVSSVRQSAKALISVLRGIHADLEDEVATSSVKATPKRQHSRKSTWIKQIDHTTGHEFFYDTATGQSEWQLPPGEAM